MTSEQGMLGAVLNGEIYNYRQLRKGLLGAGHVLVSEGDTEVIAHLAEDLAPVELARSLDGMFAFAVWDSSRRRLVLGRDRLGKKPLYYWSDAANFVFASELKALLAHPLVPRRMDPEALSGYLTFGYVSSPRTFFEGICSVPPGCVLVLDQGRTPMLLPYWEPVVLAAGTLPQTSLNEAGRTVRSALSSAVERRLEADVPLGAFLSGGVDSSSVVALMSGLMNEPVNTFTIGFEDSEGFDERPYARLVAERFKTNHTEFVVKPDAASLVERLVWYHDQPFGDSSALPTYLLSELTRKHVTVALCGDGGDELFAGYERFAGAIALARFQRLPTPIQEGVHGLAKMLPPLAFGGRARSLQRLLARKDEPLLDAYLSWISYVPTSWCKEMCPEGSTWAWQDYRSIWDATEGASLLDRFLALNIKTYLLDDLLPKVDRMAMAHALEVRSPFLDTALVELAFHLPPSTKMAHMSLKKVLKVAMEDLLPPQILHRRKHGFGLPLERWFRNELRGYLEARLMNESSRVRAHLEPNPIDRMVGEHLSGMANHSQALWALVTLEEFLRKEQW
jgi:asparagine synthase (glutamine-hydrolysing)